MEATRLPLKVGTYVRIRSLEDTSERAFGVRIQDLTDAAIVVQRPTDQYRPVRFPRGCPVEIWVTVEGQPGKDGRYRGESVVLRNAEEPVPLLWIAWPQQWERSQMREFFRVPVILPARIRPLVQESEKTQANVPWAKATLRDISGGGCLVVSALALQRDESVELEFTLEEQPLRVAAVVKRAEPLDDGSDRWALGLEFVGISERERRHIIRFAFRRQIDLHKKGMA